MSTSLSLGLVIGATVAAGFQTAMLTVNKTVEKLKTTSEALNIRQEQLKQKIKSLPEGASGIIKLQREYDALGKSIQRVAQHQASLKKTIEAGAQIKQQRADLRTNITETAATGIAMLAPVYGGIKAAGNHEDNVKDISITGEFDAAQEQALSQTVRAVALQMNQTTDAVSAGLKALVAGGIQSADELNRYAPVLAKTATATRAQMDDIADTFVAFANNMGISADESESAMNIMVKSTKLGQVEMNNVAKWIPRLTPVMKSLGVTGKEGIALLSSALQVTKIGAGTADEAGNNLGNFLSKITAPDTREDFKKVGIDLDASLKESALNGIDPINAMLGIVEDYMSKALSPTDLAKYQADLAEKDNAKSAEMFKSLSEAGNMGQLFQDMQAMSALRAMLQNKDKLQSFTADSLAAGNTDMLGADFDKRTAGFNEQMKQLKINLVDIGITVGETLIPSILSLVESVKPMINAVAEFAKANPELIKWGVGIMAVGIALKLFTSSLAFAWNLLVKSPVNQAAMTWKRLSATFTMAKIGLTTIAPVLVKIGSGLLIKTGSRLLSLGKGFLTVGRYALLFGQGLGMALGMPIVMLGKGLLMLTSLLGVKLLAGLRAAATGFMLLGRALFLTPLGLIVAGVAALAYGAYQLYENWEPVKQWFSDLWQSLASAASAKIDSMTATMTSWVNNIKSLFQSLLDWLDGLWQGIKDKANNGINSVQSMANNLLPSAMQFNVKPMDIPESNRLANKGNAIDQSTVHFSPTITLPPGTPEATVSTVKQALTMSQTEFEQRYKTMQRNNQRLNWSTP